MFMDDRAFDEVDEIKAASKFSRPTTAQTTSNSNSLQIEELSDDDLPAFRSAGTLNTPSSSRARMLDQQREIELKKRQANMQNGGMVRSSIDSTLSSSSPAKPSTGQFTPAARQFSAPKTVRTTTNAPSEFSRPKSSTPGRGSAARYSDDDEDGTSGAGTGTGTAAGRPPSSRPTTATNNRASTGKGYHPEEQSAPTSRSSNHNRRSNGADSSDNDYDDRHTSGGGGSGGGRGGSRDREGASRDQFHASNGAYTSSGGYKSAIAERDVEYSKNYYERDRERDRDNGGGRDGGPGSRMRQYEMDDARNGRGAGGEDNMRWDTGNSRLANTRDVDNTTRNTNTNYDRYERDNTNTNESATTAMTSAAAPVTTPVRTLPPDLSDMRKFLSTPVPKQCGVIQCYIRRNKSGTNKLYPIYSLYLKDGDVFLLASRKRPKNKTSNYLISSSLNDLNKGGSNYLGKLRSNFVGTEFQVFDDGVNPKDSEGDEVVSGTNSQIRCELGAVMYAANVLGSRGPRKMQVALPGLDENGHIIKWRDGTGPQTGTGHDDMLTRMKDRNFRDMLYLINKPPRWNEQVGAYVLNFNGRVTMASVKNFQLVDPEEQNAVVLQFGRVGKDEFTMDLQYPMSPYQAFALTLSSFDSKIACD